MDRLGRGYNWGRHPENRASENEIHTLWKRAGNASGERNGNTLETEEEVSLGAGEAMASTPGKAVASTSGNPLPGLATRRSGSC